MKMKTILVVFSVLFLIFDTRGQVNKNQINISEFENSLANQPFNADPTYNSSITQLGNYNTAKLIQTQEQDLSSNPNTSNSYQQGNFNLVDLTQKGSENVLFSFQLGYSIPGHSTENKENTQTDAKLASVLNFNASSANMFSDGNNNTLISSQEGNSNKILSIQQGSNNYIHAEQLGNDNNLVAQQVGTNNRVENFIQNNNHGESDIISQVGENITLNSISPSNSLYGNNYSQNGTNLSITLNNSTFNTLGGLKVSQTGHDMKIVIDQSYFSFPLR
jgi:hypothetical protein